MLIFPVSLPASERKKESEKIKKGLDQGHAARQLSLIQTKDEPVFSIKEPTACPGPGHCREMIRESLLDDHQNDLGKPSQCRMG